MGWAVARSLFLTEEGLRIKRHFSQNNFVSSLQAITL